MQLTLEWMELNICIMQQCVCERVIQVYPVILSFVLKKTNCSVEVMKIRFSNVLFETDPIKFLFIYKRKIPV